MKGSSSTHIFPVALLTLTLPFTVISCSQMDDDPLDEPTEIATVTGTAVGAGLGAIIGSQTGDALGGTAIGAVAGAGAGYAVGNYIEDKDTRTAQQEEQMRRHEEQIRSQQQELNELRGISSDTVTFREPATGTSSYQNPRASYSGQGYSGQGSIGQGSIGQANSTGKTYIDPATLNNPFAGNANSGTQVARNAGSAGIATGSTISTYPSANTAPPRGSAYTSTSYENTNYGSVNTYSGASGITPQGSSGGAFKERNLAAEPAMDAPTYMAEPRSIVKTEVSGNVPTARIPSFDSASASDDQVFAAAKTSAGLGATAVAIEAAPKEEMMQVEEEIEIGINNAEVNTQQEESRVVPIEAAPSDAAPSDEPLQIAVDVPAKEGANEVVDIASDTAPADGMTDSAIAKNVTSDGSDECVKAAEEARRGASAESTADKLFYFRRALRLCPDAPEWHVELGKVYGSLGRYDDAKFEYEEALRIKPGDSAAQSGLDSIQRSLY